VITDLEPLARLDSRAIAGSGAATMDDLLKAIAPITRSANGNAPIYLLNGQRTGGY
jgi:iron complex outermembrane recepter protein